MKNTVNDLKELILRYFDAFSNLYGLVSIKRAYRIIEKQNPELNLTKELFAEIVNGLDIADKYYVIWSEEEVYDEDAPDSDLFDKILISDYIITFGNPDDYEILVAEQDDRPFYIPEKNKLLEYEDEYYYEKTSQVIALECFLRDKLHIANCVEIVEELVAMLIIDDNEIDYIIDTLIRISRPRFKGFSSKEEAYEFALLYTNLRNHTRKHTHRGHTPFELDDCYEVDSVLENEIPVEVKAPSKNGPCPCGSGKKYKRCCGKEAK